VIASQSLELAFLVAEELERAVPELGFAPDLGWACYAGVDLAALLDRLDERIAVLHFKDLDRFAAEPETVQLGSGVIDFAPAWAWLQLRPDRDVWVTAEQDHAADADAAAAHNGALLTARLHGQEIG